MASILDLTIVNTHNPKTMGIGDISVYDPNQIIATPTLEITPPGFGKIAIPFIVNSVNVLNSNTLNLTSVLSSDDLSILPDGIYKFKYSIQPSLSNFILKKYLRTDRLQLKYFEAFLSTDLLDCSDSREYCLPDSGKKALESKLREIELMINGAIAAANNGDDITAMNMYSRANILLDKFNICKTC